LLYSEVVGSPKTETRREGGYLSWGKKKGAALVFYFYQEKPRGGGREGETYSVRQIS